MFVFSFSREPIGLIVLELLENGFLQKMHKKWWFDKGECVPEDSKVNYWRRSVKYGGTMYKLTESTGAWMN
jgi:hypothetical protein